jgi:hypothetical protein
MKVERLSVLLTGRLYPREYSRCSFVVEAELTPGLCEAGRIKLMKNLRDPIETRDLLAAQCLNLLRYGVQSDLRITKSRDQNEYSGEYFLLMLAPNPFSSAH